MQHRTGDTSRRTVLALGLLVILTNDGLGFGLGRGYAAAGPARVPNLLDHHAQADLARTADGVVTALRALGAASTEQRSAAREHLKRAMETVRLPEHLPFFSADDLRSTRLCRLCYVVAESFFDAIREQNKTDEDLAEIVTELCTVTNAVAPHICRGLISSNTPVIQYIAKNNPDLDGMTTCGVLLQDCYDISAPGLNWTITKEMGVKPWEKINNLLLHWSPPVEVDPYRILQVTDFHWDPDYNLDGTAVCADPVCCRKDQGPPAQPSDRPGRWGDYRNCDIPWRTVEDFIRHVQDVPFDIVYYTGDVVDHGVWATSREGNERVLRSTFAAMKEAFGDTPVIPIVGNHEPHPLNLYAPDYITEESLSTRWLYDILADIWINKNHWLPEDTRPTILRGGFYTMLVRPGFRIVSMNTNYCYLSNWWLLHDAEDLSGQLSWFIDVLQAAEQANEKVHVLSHIPPGRKDCLEAWGREFAKIVDRFSATISAQFNGHSHRDDFVIFYDKHGRPNNAAFNGGSLTTHTNVNPNYKLYHIDGNHKKATWDVLNTELWGFNLTHANMNNNGRPEWYQMYSFRETFNVKSLHPVHLDMFVERLAKDHQLVQEYYRYHMLDSDVSHQTGCDSNCAERLICASVTAITNNYDQCDRLLNKRRSFP